MQKMIFFSGWKGGRKDLPILAMSTQMSQASPSVLAFLPRDSSMTMAFKRPLPLISVTNGEFKLAIPSRSFFPIASALPAKSSSTSTFKDSMATAQPNGFPPYVLPCSPGLMLSMMLSSHRTADTGIVPPDKALPKTRISRKQEDQDTAR